MLTALLIVRFLMFPLSDAIWQAAQGAVRRSPSITLLCCYGFNLTLNFMAGSKGVYSISKSIMGQVLLEIGLSTQNSSTVALTERILKNLKN